MSQRFPRIYLARHGETLWSISGQHTGRTDIVLTERGEIDAKALGQSLQKLTFAAVFTSPLQRTDEPANLPDLPMWRRTIPT